jgi:eukaryotic-like serine/threonine-protein kinase
MPGASALRLADAFTTPRVLYRTLTSCSAMQRRFPSSGRGQAAYVLPERYANVERIGQGGMGDIVRTEDTALGRVVAVKLLAERYAADPSIRARFTREALAAARVSAAPNTVTIFDVGEWADRPYIVMEYLPGGSIADRLQREGAQPPGRALEWLEGAARALDAAHRQGVVHRDVKPANLLLDDQSQVKVADFGLDPLTQVGTVLGTVGYLSPEQARGERAEPASDRYALGVVAFELLTGRRPFERESPTAEAAAHVNETLPPVASINPELPRELDRVLGRALAKDPAARYESCGELVAELRGALRQDAAPTRVIPAGTAAGKPTVATAPPAPSPARRPLWPVVAGAVALLALGGVAVASIVAGDEPQTGGQTVERTITTQGDTVTVTETTPAEPPPPPSPPSPPPAQGGDPAQRNDEGFALMQDGNYEAALPLLEQAVAGTQGEGSLTEAYASYNLAFTRLQLGDCTGVLELLDRSEQVQGQRTEIDELRAQAQRECSGGGGGSDGAGGDD